jgi:prolipoprotein diacylglyceryltransferase
MLTVGPLSIPGYTILLDLGLILGLFLTYLEGKRLVRDGELALNLGLWMVLGGIVAGRIAYVLANWRAFSEDWARALRIWEGGLSFHGAFLGGVLVLALARGYAARGYAARETLPTAGDGSHWGQLSLWQMADLVSPGLAAAVTFGWAACLVGGCAYGQVGEGLGYVILPDLYGVEAPRFATQLVAIAYSLVLWIGLWLLRERWPFSGASFLMFVLFYFAGMFFLEFTRGDEALYVGPWRLSQILDLMFAFAAGIGLWILWWRYIRGAAAGGSGPTAVPLRR